MWHTDSSFNPHRSSYSLLLAHEVPPVGGDTQFADMRAAYDCASPLALKAKIEDLWAEHWLWHSRMLAGYPEPTEAERQAKPPARHKLVQVHPGLGAQDALYRLARLAHRRLADRGRSPAAARVDRIRHPAAIRAAVAWKQAGDLVIWDNRCTMHRATPSKTLCYRRDMRRTTVYDSVV